VAGGRGLRSSKQKKRSRGDRKRNRKEGGTKVEVETVCTKERRKKEERNGRGGRRTVGENEKEVKVKKYENEKGRKGMEERRKG
jgi:hypothetical protein